VVAAPPLKRRLARGGLLLISLGLFALVALPGRSPEAWVAVQDREAGCRFEMPVEPEREADTARLAGHELARVSYLAREHGSSYALTRFDLSGTPLAGADPEPLFDALRDRWLARIRGDLTLERSERFAGGPARELVAVRSRDGRPEIRHRARLFLVGERLFLLETRGPYVTSLPTEVEAFLDSFRASATVGAP